MNGDRTVDVVVVGAGMAGLCAAIAAAKMGLEVALLEKHEKVGGSTSYSWGFIWVAPNHLAQAAGEEDNDDDIRAYMRFLTGGLADPERLDTFVTRSPEALKFFEDAGVELQLARGLTDHYHGIGPGSRATGRSIEVKLIAGGQLGEWQDKVLTPPAIYGVTGEEMIAWGGMNNATNWPADIVAERRRNDDRGLGVGLVSQLLRALLKLGVEPTVGTGVERLIVDGGRVTGVETGCGYAISARKGVVITTGGYESSAEMVDAFEGLPGWQSMFPLHLTGDGLKLGQEIGAAIRSLKANMSLFLGYNVPGDPPFFRIAGIIEMCSPHTLVVNRAGRRFTDESYFQGMIPSLLTFDPMKHAFTNLPCYLIFDEQYVGRYSVAGLAPGSPVPDWVARGETLGELAGKLGVDAGGLEATVERFNGFARNGTDEDFGRGEIAWTLAKETGQGGNRSLGTVEKGPFYGLELRPSSIGSAGLSADAAGRVLHVRGHAIPGLYASGNVAARTEYGAGYQAGHTLASGMTFSYLAIRDMLGAAT